MEKETKSTVLIAIVGAISAIVVAVITTYGTIALSDAVPKAELEMVKVKVQKVRVDADSVSEMLRQISERQKFANLPIGTIVPSMLPPKLFEEVVGDPSVFDPEKSKWVLADSLEDITRSQYGKLLNNARHTPDLRGMFLRGMNEGRKDSLQDPEQNRTAGDYQRDALQKHGHKTDALTFLQYNSGDTKALGYTSKGGADYTKATVKDVMEDEKTAEETRPRNVAVYFYIKIN